MLKKVLIVISAITVLFLASVFSLAPLFSSYSKRYEAYLYNSSSLAKIVNVNKTEFIFLKGVKGESVRLSANNFDLSGLLLEFDAEIIFTERVENKTLYYAYSPRIKYKKVVRGQKINLQIATDSDNVTIGSPLIFGSF